MDGWPVVGGNRNMLLMSTHFIRSITSSSFIFLSPVLADQRLKVNAVLSES